MATELATAWIKLQPSFDGVQGSIAKELGGVDTDGLGKTAGKKFAGGMSNTMKVGLAAASTAAIAGIGAIFTTGLEELKFGEKISAQTEQLLKNTGSKLSTDWIEDYTLSLSKLSGISEEDLQSAGNSVLKFGDLSQENYEKAVSSINDLGAAGKDVAGVGEALGKALADPAKGAALLKRQGVLLNEEQKALIANFTEAGDKAGAQGVILDALETSYGGMAEATGGTLEGNLAKLGNAWENMAGTAVEQLMPAIKGLVEGLGSFFTFMEENEWVLPVIGVALGILAVALIAFTVAQWAANVAMLASPMTWIILAIVALIAVIVLLVMNWDTVVKFLTDVWDGFITWFQGVMDAFLGWWNDLWTAVWEWVVSIWESITDSITRFMLDLWIGLQAIGSAISDWWNGLWTGVWEWLVSIWEGIVAGVKWYFGMLWLAIQVIGNTITSWWNGLWSGISSFFSGIWEGILKVFNGAKTTIENVIKTVTDIVNGVKKTFEDVAKGIKAAFDGIGKFIKDAFGPVMDFFGGAGQAVSNFFGGMGDAARNVKGKLKDFKPVNTGGYTGGAALARVTPLMRGLTGLHVTDTLSNRAADAAMGLDRSVNSYHYDAQNPAVDIAGPNDQLWALYRRIQQVGGWRQILWQVAGHYDHIHVAHAGGVVSPSWARMPGDKADERTVRLQVGETVLPRGFGGQAPTGDLGALGGAPQTLIIVDADGQLIGRMRVEADARITTYDDHRMRTARRGELV